MTPETPKYDPKEAFKQSLDEKQAEALKIIQTTVGERMDWSTRQQRHDWGAIAENRLNAVLSVKTKEVNAEIQKIIESQIGDLNASEKNTILKVQAEVFKSMQGRVQLGLEMASTSNGALPTVSTDIELAKLSEMMGWIENMDVQYMVFQSLPGNLQKAYVESVGRSFRTDFHEILKKNQQSKPLSEGDWEILINETKVLGENANTMQTSQVMLVLGNLSLLNRTELVQRMAKEESFPNFAALLTTMVGAGYLSALVASEAIEMRIDFLQTELADSRRKDGKLIKEELTALEASLARVNSEGMRETQAKLSEHRVKAAKYYSTRTYGHRNRARGLLSVKGIGSALLTVNGGLTIAANVMMGLHDPTDLPLNPALWIGVAQMGGGLYMSDGHGGLLSTPQEMLASITKDEHEERDNRMDEYRAAMQAKLNNAHREAHFYANYAERIVQVYKAKSNALNERKVPITLADIGVSKKEDLPTIFQEMWEKRSLLEAKITDWAAQFALIDAEAGMKITEGDTQRKFIADARKQENAKPMEIIELTPFVYTPVKA